MSIVRVHKTNNFTVMSNHHFKEKEMTLKAKGLLSLMLSLPDDWNYSISGLVKLSKDGKDAVMSALGELEKFGYLKRQRVKNESGQFSGIEYHIYEEPQTEKPIAGKPITEYAKAEKANAENAPQLNKKELNTKKSNNKEINYEEILSPLVNMEVKDLYYDYIEMRKSINSPLTERALKMLMDRVDRLSGFNPQTAKELLETAIINGWKNVYPPKPKPSTITEGNNGFMRELQDIYMED